MSDEQDRPAMLSDLATWKNEITSLIREEAETTRRHFDIVAENMGDRVKVVADGVAHHTTVLDDHENRLHEIEKQR
jgi:hypothetical protein